ncbi:general substrate transporter [Hyaloscypha variabilis F]|uniref:General substrate transporter n=1 Tax=Hyaloscypha variabilis (strain UAMH 11265 / GT02V1 / F) TaxID=1149755 RepID=A0A2J6RSV0_HYAVF|nr:general substrate transporter [Hyaloscypha variabilis F]
MVEIKAPAVAAREQLAADHQDAPPEFEHVEWTKDPGLRKLYILSAFGLLVASATTGYDGSLLNLLQQYDYWETYFNHVGTDKTKANLLGLLTNMFTIGSIISMFIVPTITDRWGRKPCIIGGCLFMIVGGFVNTFSTSYGMFCAGRFILGFGNSLAQLASPMLLTEIVHPLHRARITTVYNCLWNLGNLICTLIGYGLQYVNNNWSWRALILFQIIFAVCQLCFIWFIPESPRWLISKDRNEEALKTLAKWHANGNENNLTVQFEYREIRETLRIEKEVNQTTSYLDFFRTKGNRWRLAIIISIGIISQYSGNAVISNYANLIYTNAGITHQNQKLGLSIGNALLSLIVSISAAFMVDRAGRRPLFLISVTGMVISFILWTIMAAMYETHNDQQSFGIAQIVFVWIFGIFYSIGFSGLLVAYTLEVLPYHLRAKGVMIMNITVQAILALSAQTNPVAIEHLPAGWNFWLFYTLWDVVEAIWVYFVFVETKGPTLEEIAKIFDGEDAVAHIDMAQTEKEIEIHQNEQGAQKPV